MGVPAIGMMELPAFLHFFNNSPPMWITPDAVKIIVSPSQTASLATSTWPPSNSPLLVHSKVHPSQSDVTEYGGQLHPHPAIVRPAPGSETIVALSGWTWPLAIISKRRGAG